MPDIRAIHGLRYDLGHIGALADVIAPPASTLTPDQIDQLYKRHPANIVRVLTNREEPGDDELNNPHSRAKRFLTDWQRQGVLQREPDPAIYVYHQEFDWQGQRVTRRGFLAGLALEDIDQEQYEAVQVMLTESFSSSLNRLRATGADITPQVSVYADPSISVQQDLENHIAMATPLVAKDASGVVHRLWPVTDHNLIGTIREKMAHHRLLQANQDEYAAATLYRYELAQEGELTPQHPANVALTAFFEMTEPGFEVLPRFPLAHQAPAVSSQELIEKLGIHFDCQVFGQGPSASSSLWEELQTSNELGHLGIYCTADDTWVRAQLTADGQLRMEDATPERDDVWRELDNNLWEWLILTELLETADAKESFVRTVDHLVQALDQDQAKTIPLAALLRPVTMSQYQDLIDRKVDFFEAIAIGPLPPCGLVLHPFS
ncbi:hypothetical protein Pan97_43170 [Bremerella volcania]|uniref:DUF1015 domain-containing protein n=1 Tax=Bremerella volcania TaxID=2527984 RepID=A0A518CDG5_9BACT|nr:DUF1015 domain-containing protein [Bremerella volcania]QDU77252.1 hypothetical protein Pan97_43170 [Bremerella volcania]